MKVAWGIPRNAEDYVVLFALGVFHVLVGLFGGMFHFLVFPLDIESLPFFKLSLLIVSGLYLSVFAKYGLTRLFMTRRLPVTAYEAINKAVLGTISLCELAVLIGGQAIGLLGIVPILREGALISDGTDFWGCQAWYALTMCIMTRNLTPAKYDEDKTSTHLNGTIHILVSSVTIVCLFLSTGGGADFPAVFVGSIGLYYPGYASATITFLVSCCIYAAIKGVDTFVQNQK